MGHHSGRLGRRSNLCWRRRRLLQETLHRLRRLGPTADPVVQALAIQNDLRRRTPRIVMPQDLDEAPIPRSLAINHHHSETALLFGSASSQAYSQQSSPSTAEIPSSSGGPPMRTSRASCKSANKSPFCEPLRPRQGITRPPDPPAFPTGLVPVPADSDSSTSSFCAFGSTVSRPDSLAGQWFRCPWQCACGACH